MPTSDNRERMLEHGMELIYANGFESTGVQEITGSCGVPKGSFYYYFDSKEAFALAVLERYSDTARATLVDTLLEGSGSPLDRLRGLLAGWTDELEESEFKHGCLAGNLCQEMAEKSPEFRKTLDRCFDQMQGYFTACLEQAQQAGEIDAREDPAALAEFVYNGWQGALLRMKTSRSRKPLDSFQKLLFERVLH